MYLSFDRSIDRIQQGDRLGRGQTNNPSEGKQHKKTCYRILWVYGFGLIDSINDQMSHGFQPCGSMKLCFDNDQHDRGRGGRFRLSEEPPPKFLPVHFLTPWRLFFDQWTACRFMESKRKDRRSKGTELACCGHSDFGTTATQKSSKKWFNQSSNSMALRRKNCKVVGNQLRLRRCLEVA